jgi:hypothetical protein
MLTYDTPATSHDMGTYMKLVTKYQISAINSCWEKCAYMFNVYKNQLSRQTGSRNLWWFQKRFPRYGIPMWSLWPNIRFLPSIVAEKNMTKNILEGRTDRGKTVYPPPPSGSGGIIRSKIGSKCVDLILIRLAKCWNTFFSSKFCIWLYCENGKYMIILWKCQVGIYFFLLSSQICFFKIQNQNNFLGKKTI